MNHKSQHPALPNHASKNWRPVSNANKHVKAGFSTTPNLLSFSMQKNSSNVQYKSNNPVNKNQINVSNIKTVKRPLLAISNLIDSKKPEMPQIIYKQCGHHVHNKVNNWINNNVNTKNNFPRGISTNSVQVHKIIPPTNMYKKRVQTNADAEQKNTQTKVSEPQQVQETINKSTPQQNKTPQINNQARTEKTNQGNPKETKRPANKSKNVPPPQPRPETPPYEKVTEIYKRNGPIYSDSSTSSKVSEPPNSENMSFQKVTQDLANIIKNFQKQINEVPLTNGIVEQVPSAMLQPKIKEFFKQTSEDKSPPKNNNTTNKNPPKNNSGNKQPQTNKNQQQPSTKIQNSNVKEHSSLRSLLSDSSKASIKRFSSFTHHNLTIQRSLSNRIMRGRGSSLTIDPLKQLKDEVQNAIRNRKTFTVRGHYQAIRNALLARGWIEKLHPSFKDQLNEELKRYTNYTISDLLPLLRKDDLTSTCKMLIKSKLLGGYQVDFYWGVNDEAFKENPDKIKYTIINKLKRDIFSYTNKQGLCDASKLSYWYQKSNVSKLNHPRSYSLGKNGDLKGFVEDFYMTAAMSLLKWVVKTNSTKECKLISPSGEIPVEAFDFALNECCKFIKKGRHEDIDMQIPEAKEQEWTKFLDYFYKLVHYSNHFKNDGTETEDSLVRKSNYILNNLRTFYPFVDMDGIMNIWILKPISSSRGRGIHMCRTLQYVLKIIKQNHHVRYIIQKYIERPLLIYNTKFDIRQWFLISNCSPLTIWMYKECYLRFSSQTYNLRKLHESIHLTNNSVQCKYKNNSVDTALPSYNMWDSNDFQKYLTNIGYPNAFKDIIYPGMRQCINAAVMMHQDKMIVRKNSFELYGADFILTEDFQPWLLEINSNPALYASTPVTARMCPKVLEDVIKVVIDYAHNNKANTGGFEMIYKEQPQNLPAPASLEVKGLSLRSSYFFNGLDQELSNSFSISNYTDDSVIDQSKESLKVFGEEIKKTLKDLLQIIHNEKLKRGLNHQRNTNLAPAVSVK